MDLIKLRLQVRLLLCHGTAMVLGLLLWYCDDGDGNDTIVVGCCCGVGCVDLVFVLLLWH